MALTGGGVLYAWNEWAVHVLVLLSFILQVALLILAELRRRMDSGLLRAFVWSAYMLADATAIYVLGHMSVIVRLGLAEHNELMAFWAPFLLVHLGGQDNISAYAIEDNHLWLRHLQTLLVQVGAAAYVIYESSSIHRWPELRRATVLMLVVGVIKYGERVWALRCAGSNPLGNNYRSIVKPSEQRGRFPKDRIGDTETLLSIAHLMLDVAKDRLKGPLPYYPHYSAPYIFTKDLFKVVEMQLSLMHDVLYTKAEVLHTWCGFCVRLVSMLFTTISLLSFHNQIVGGNHKDLHYSRSDIHVTYVLLVGAFVLELMSVLRAMFSSWTCAAMKNWKFHHDESLANRRDEGKLKMVVGRVLNLVVICVLPEVTSFRRFVHAADWRRRYWSGSMGQHNLLTLCAGSTASRWSKRARRIGIEDPWNVLVYSWSTTVSKRTKKLLVDSVGGSQDEYYKQRRLAVESKRVSSVGSEGSSSSGLQADLLTLLDYKEKLAESILVLHIATDLYIDWFHLAEGVKVEEGPGGAAPANAGARQQLFDLAEAVEGLSNYMLYLLAARTYMLPPSAKRDAYVWMCYCLTNGLSGVTNLSKQLRWYGDALRQGRPSDQYLNESARNNQELQNGCRLGASLISEPGSDTIKLEMISKEWMKMLFHAASECSAYSHAKQLSDGGELITVAALLKLQNNRVHITPQQ